VIQARREQAVQLNQQPDHVEIATESARDNAKAGSWKASDTSKDGFQQARQWARDSIAP